MSNTVTFANRGALDICAIKTFGMSAKADGAIGFFGTGLKYAIAICLREGQEIEIEINGDLHSFDTICKELRGSTFQIVRMDGEEIGFTTELGKTWELWQAFRELYCNAQDEGGETGIDIGTDGADTIVRVTGHKMAEIFNTKRHFILDGHPLHTGQSADAYPKKAGAIFFQRIKVLEPQKPTLADYNIKSKIVLTEDRTAKFAYQASDAIAEMIATSERPDFIHANLTCGDGWFEASLNYSDVFTTPSAAFLDCAEDLLRTKAPDLNRTVRSLVEQHRGCQSNLSPVPLTAVQTEMLKRATEFNIEMGYPVGEYPIVVTDDLGRGVLGQAKDRTIYIATKTFDMGTKMLAGTLLEEFLHLRYGYQDESREMQNFLFDRLMSAGEELRGAPL